MLLLSIGDHRSRLEVGYGLEPILPDGLDGDILREMRPALRQSDFGDAMIAAAQTIGQFYRASQARAVAGPPAAAAQTAGSLRPRELADDRRGGFAPPAALAHRRSTRVPAAAGWAPFRG